uniref:Protein kinase domain-containing protein n=1 Tax=Ganoderma boninense TaxID=34458 RepID=A0A5K1JUF9_9APHY|nr:Protein kinase domain-containing protein [Ganoderma boninense]
MPYASVPPPPPPDDPRTPALWHLWRLVDSGGIDDSFFAPAVDPDKEEEVSLPWEFEGRMYTLKKTASSGLTSQGVRPYIIYSIYLGPLTPKIRCMVVEIYNPRADGIRATRAAFMRCLVDFARNSFISVLGE